MVKGTSGPLVTLALVAYNQEKYIAEAIAAALAQTYSPLEVILSDDCSTDGTFGVMEQAAACYAGPHRIVLNRNPVNLNLGAHVDKVGHLATGDLILLAAGDDLSLPGRAQELVDYWSRLGRPTVALYSDFAAMDANGVPVSSRREFTYLGPFLQKDLAEGTIHVLGATSAYTKNVFSGFPPIDPSVRHEDRVLSFRALLLGGQIACINKKLIRYRIEGGMSRDRITSAHYFLFDHLPAVTRRILPDARQRLLDLERVAPNNSKLRAACLATIADHEAAIEMTDMRGISHERRLVKWLFRGARPKNLLSLYLKTRGYPLYKLYSDSKAKRAS